MVLLVFSFFFVFCLFASLFGYIRDAILCKEEQRIIKALLYFHSFLSFFDEQKKKKIFHSFLSVTGIKVEYKHVLHIDRKSDNSRSCISDSIHLYFHYTDI